MAQEITLGDFIRLLAMTIPDHGRVMPFQDEAPWHTVFYRLKKETEDPKPQFLANLSFDWDGPFPKSQDISDFLQALHWTGSVAALNPGYEQIIVPQGTQERWRIELKDLSPETKKILDRSIKLAAEEFPVSAGS
jgi:hypothetical protein